MIGLIEETGVVSGWMAFGVSRITDWWGGNSSLHLSVAEEQGWYTLDYGLQQGASALAGGRALWWVLIMKLQHQPLRTHATHNTCCRVFRFHVSVHIFGGLFLYVYTIIHDFQTTNIKIVFACTIRTWNKNILITEERALKECSFLWHDKTFYQNGSFYVLGKLVCKRLK